MGLKVSKSVILPRIDRIQDPETRRVIQELLRVIQDLNATYCNDLTYLGLEDQSGCKAYRATSNQVIATGTATIVQFNAESYDIQGEFSTVSFGFTAKKEGKYLVVTAVNYVTFPAANKIQLNILVNGGLVITNETTTGKEDYVSCFTTGIVSLNANDVITVNTAHWAGSNKELRYGENYTFLNIVKIQ